MASKEASFNSAAVAEADVAMTAMTAMIVVEAEANLRKRDIE
jgi:hypothetical protein